MTATADLTATCRKCGFAATGPADHPHEIAELYNEHMPCNEVRIDAGPVTTAAPLPPPEEIEGEEDGEPGAPVPAVTAQVEPAEVKGPAEEKLDGAIAFDRALGITPKADKKAPAKPKPTILPDADIYDLAMRATASQGRMIFAMLNKDYGIRDDMKAKAVIKGFVNERNSDSPITSTKELSKQQAGDLITWLQEGQPEAEMQRLIDKYEEPF